MKFTHKIVLQRGGYKDVIGVQGNFAGAANFFFFINEVKSICYLFN